MRKMTFVNLNISRALHNISFKLLRTYVNKQNIVGAVQIKKENKNSYCISFTYTGNKTTKLAKIIESK